MLAAAAASAALGETVDTGVVAKSEVLVVSSAVIDEEGGSDGWERSSTPDKLISNSHDASSTKFLATTTDLL